MRSARYFLCNWLLLTVMKCIYIGLDNRNRTCGIVTPNHVLYQTELYPDMEQHTGFEPAQPAWKAGMLAVKHQCCILVRMVGFEPTRCKPGILSPLCLPIPSHPHLERIVRIELTNNSFADCSLNHLGICAFGGIGRCRTFILRIFSPALRPHKLRFHMVESRGLEPLHRINDGRISNPLQYQLCLTLHKEVAHKHYQRKMKCHGNFLLAEWFANQSYPTMVRHAGFEPTTNGLKVRCSTD